MTPNPSIEPSFEGRVRLLALTLAWVAWAAAMYGLVPPLLTYLRGLPLCESLTWARLSFLGFSLPVIAAGLFTLRRGTRAIRMGQWPVPGTLVWSRTQVQHGWRAKFEGSSLILSGVLAILAPLILVHYTEVRRIFYVPSSWGC